MRYRFLLVFVSIFLLTDHKAGAEEIIPSNAEKTTTEGSSQATSEALPDKAKDEVYYRDATASGQKITSNPNDYHSFRFGASIEVEPTSGSAAMVVPLATVPGRAGVQPNL